MDRKAKSYVYCGYYYISNLEIIAMAHVSFNIFPVNTQPAVDKFHAMIRLEAMNLLDFFLPVKHFLGKMLLRQLGSLALVSWTRVVSPLIALTAFLPSSWKYTLYNFKSRLRA